MNRACAQEVSYLGGFRMPARHRLCRAHGGRRPEASEKTAIGAVHCSVSWSVLWHGGSTSVSGHWTERAAGR